MFETFRDGVATGHTPEFIEVRVRSDRPLHAETYPVRLTEVTPDGEACLGILDKGDRLCVNPTNK